MSNYTPHTSPNYMTSDWGNTQAKHAAIHVDHLADKAKFAIEMLEGVVHGFDAIEKEIVDASTASVPPTREAIRAYAYRIDVQQKQLQDALTRLKGMMTDIDKVTDNIQSPRTSW